MFFTPSNDTVSYNTTSDNSSTNTPSNSNDSNTANSSFLIAIEVLFSLLVVFILGFCFLAGLKRKRIAREFSRNMVENAVNQQERRNAIRSQTQHSTSSTVTTLIQYPPPIYSPPDPLNQLSSDAVSRLDHVLLENHIATIQPNPPLPKYSDLYRQ